MSFFVSPIVALIVLVPLVACAVVLLDALADKAADKKTADPKSKGKAPPPIRWSERAVVFGAGGALASALIALVKLFASGSAFGYFHALRFLRVGMMDASLTFSIDPLRGIGAAAVAGGASWAALLLAKRGTTRAHASLLLLLAGAELVIVADGALGIVLGLTVLSIGALLSEDPRAAWLARAGGLAAALVLVAASLLAWGAGGEWSADDYTPELYPRFSLTKKPIPISEDGKKEGHAALDTKKLATISMASMGASFIYLDDSRSPWEIDKRIVHPPFFEEPITSGIHSFRIHQGYGSDDHVLSHVNVEDGQNMIIVPVGATLSPRELKDQLTVLPAPTDDVPLPTVETFRETRVLGLRVATLAQSLWILAAALVAFASLAWGLGKPDVAQRARSTMLLAAAATLAYRVDFLARIPTAAWIVVIGAAAALGFFVSRSSSDAGARIVALFGRVGDLALDFDRRVLDVPLRVLSFTRKVKAPPATMVALLIALSALGALAASHGSAWAGPTGAMQASAAPATGTADVVLSAGGTRGPLVLVPKGSELSGQFEIENRGKTPITITRVAVRSDAKDVRAPAVLSIKTDGPAPMALAPGARSKVTVTLGRVARVEELYAQVVVTTSLEGSSEIAMGVVGHSATRNAEPFGRNILSAIVALLAGAGGIVLLLALMRTTFAGRAAAGGAGVALALVGLLVHRFEPALSRIEGNDGLSFIERSPLSFVQDAELFFAADGVALVFALVLVAGAGLALLFVAEESLPTFERPFLLLATAAAAGAVFSQDLLLFVLFFGAACVLATLCVRAAQPTGASGFGRLRVVVLLAVVAVAVTVFALHDASDRSYAVDGTVKDHTFTLQELARVAFASKSVTLLGAPLVKSAYVLLVLAFAALAGAPPFHGASLAISAEAKSPTGLFALALVRVLGLYGLVHVIVPVLPESCRWGAGGVAWLGALGAVYAAVCAFAEKGLGRKLGYLLAAQAGLTLVGFAAVAPQGMTAVLFGAVSLAVAHLACGSLAGLGANMDAPATDVGAFDARTRGVLVLAVLSAMGAPLFPGFVSSFAAVVGATARHPAVVLLFVIAFGFLCVTAARVVGAALAGTPAPAKPMQTAHNWAVFMLVLATLTTGVFPGSCLDLAANAIKDRIISADPPGSAEVAMK